MLLFTYQFSHPIGLSLVKSIYDARSLSVEVRQGILLINCLIDGDTRKTSRSMLHYLCKEKFFQSSLI
jgi:hypothetical protein